MYKTTRKLTRTSKYSFVLSIPKQIVEKYGWRERQKLVVKDKGRGVLEVKDWRSR